MGFVVDIIIIVVILLCIFDGYRKGLVGMLFSIVSFIISVILAFALFNPVASLIKNNTELDENIQTAIITNFTSEDSSEDNGSENLPDVITNYIEKTANDIKNSSIESVAVNISDTCVNGLSFFGIFLVARIVLFIISKVANLIAELPLLKQVNKAGGFLIGIIKGLLIVYIVFAIISFLAPVFEGSQLYSVINESFIGNFMYDNNLLFKLVFKQ